MAAAAAVQQPVMATHMDTNAVPAPSSLTARRPAANNLPSMIELPMPPFSNQPITKPVPVSNMNPSQTAQTSVGNLLTPPSTVPGDGLSPLSAIIGGTNNSSGSQLGPSYGHSNHNSHNNNHSMSAWLPPPPSVTTPSGLASGTGVTPNSWTSSLRGMFSPSILSTIPSHSNSSPARADGIPPPPYDMSQPPPFSSSGPMSAPSTLPALSAQQPLSYMGQQSQQMATHHASLSHASQATPMSNSDSYMPRPQSTPSSYYPQSQPSSAAQSSFPPFNVTTPPIQQQSPMSAPLMGTRISPVTPQGATFSPNGSQYTGFRNNPISSYSLPALHSGPPSAPLAGPVLTNMNTHNNQVTMMGMPGHGHGLPSGALANGFPLTSAQAAQMFATQHQPPTERPFKCDQCPQSFNRNHDLKRHKRIHLAVKPFPCTHCDKSFSRKDALKRHILVKGCGKNLPSRDGGDRDRRDRQDSPDAKSESSEDSVVMSDVKHSI